MATYRWLLCLPTISSAIAAEKQTDICEASAKPERSPALLQTARRSWSRIVTAEAPGDDVASLGLRPAEDSAFVAPRGPAQASGLHRVVGPDGVLMISLARQPERFAQSSARLVDVGIHATLLQAVDKQDPSVSDEFLNSTCPTCETRGLKALIRSHQLALMAAQKRTHSEWTAILEDDVVPAIPDGGLSWSEAFDAAWDLLPSDALFVRLGFCIPVWWQGTRKPSEMGLHIQTYADAGRFRLSNWLAIDDRYFPGGCTHAYMVHRSVIPLLLSILPCPCSWDCCLMDKLFIDWQGKHLMNIVTQETPDEAYEESKQHPGFLSRVMQWGVLQQDFASQIPKTTNTGDLWGDWEKPNEQS
mmetsp:Transcript_153055/g.285177  ORF Transcript_153055/g.285177 Transcript_153055/m.285177 type:complete len:359 (-) Transcript_153055:110-1186(-)